VYEGRIPSVYRVVERMPQWTTRMSRQTTIAGSKPLPPFDWDAIGPEVFRTKELLDTVLSSRVSKAFSDAVILVWNGGGIVYVNNIGEGTFSNSDFHDGIPGPDDLTVKYETQDVLNRQRARLQVIADTSIGTPTGLFSLVSQIAPTGGGHFDDLIMVDSSDRSQWLLAVLTKQNNDYVVYRRLYREPR
jgi:hypothetical protein